MNGFRYVQHIWQFLFMFMFIMSCYYALGRLVVTKVCSKPRGRRSGYWPAYSCSLDGKNPVFYN